jgi:hypothetical protein
MAWCILCTFFENGRASNNSVQGPGPALLGLVKSAELAHVLLAKTYIAGHKKQFSTVYRRCSMDTWLLQEVKRTARRFTSW